MALKLTRKLPGIDGSVVAGNVLTQKLPIGLTYHQVFIEYAFLATATPTALEDAIGEIRLMMNGKPVWAIQASELDKKNQFESRSAALGILCIDFDRYNLRSRGAEEFTSIGTGAADDATPLTTLTLEFDVKVNITSGTFAARARQSESRVLGGFKKIRRYTYNVPGASTDFQIDNIPRGDLINAVYFFESANDIDNLRLERDNFIMFDRSKELNARIQTDGVRTPLADLFVFDTAEDGNGTDQLVTQGVKDLRWFLSPDGAMTLTAVVESIGGLSQ